MRKISIRPMTKDDIHAVAQIHSQVFERQRASRSWISSNINAYPRILMYVAISENEQIVGYIQWLQKSGFRKESVIELEQIAVLPALQSNKIGTELINQSLDFVKTYLSSQQANLKSIIVTKRSDNLARKLYEKTLNAKMVATIKHLYSADEVIMIADIK